MHASPALARLARPRVPSGYRAALLNASIAAGIVAGGAQAQSRAQAPVRLNVQTIGPQVGARVPDFSLPDQGGQPRTLDSLMGPQGVVLVFFRSADW